MPSNRLAMPPTGGRPTPEQALESCTDLAGFTKILEAWAARIQSTADQAGAGAAALAVARDRLAEAHAAFVTAEDELALVLHGAEDFGLADPEA